MPARRDGTEPIIAHGSIYLRPAERSDIALFVAWFDDARTSRTLAFRAPISVPMEERWFDQAVAEQGKSGYHFVACLMADDRPIGTIGLFDLDLLNGSAGVGISVGDPADTGKGHGTDMLLALLAFAFGSLRLERVWLDVYDFNERAKRVYERVGFVEEGRLRHAFFHDGAHHDAFRMSILRDEWAARRAGAAGEAR